LQKRKTENGKLITDYRLLPSGDRTKKTRPCGPRLEGISLVVLGYLYLARNNLLRPTQRRQWLAKIKIEVAKNLGCDFLIAHYGPHDSK
jgi:hypothetical protein